VTMERGNEGKIQNLIFHSLGFAEASRDCRVAFGLLAKSNFLVHFVLEFLIRNMFWKPSLRVEERDEAILSGFTVVS